MSRDPTIPDLLFLDVETSGLYREDLSIDDPGQPWALQVAAALCNRAGVMTNFFCHLIAADGRRSKENALKIHGISPRMAAQLGVPEQRVFGVLIDMLKTGSVETAVSVITWSNFDPRVIASLLGRFAISLGKPSSTFDKMWLNRPLVQWIDLMAPYAQMACKLTGEYQDYKYPTLDEAMEIILGRPRREGEHDAWTDLMITKDIFFKLMERGHFPTATP